MDELKDIKTEQKVSVRLKIAEILFTTGSQVDKKELEKNGEQLYNFVMGIKPMK